MTSDDLEAARDEVFDALPLNPRWVAPSGRHLPPARDAF